MPPGLQLHEQTVLAPFSHKPPDCCRGLCRRSPGLLQTHTSAVACLEPAAGLQAGGPLLQFPVMQSLTWCSDTCVSYLLDFDPILKWFWSIALSSPGLVSLGISLSSSQRHHFSPQCHSVVVPLPWRGTGAQPAPLQDAAYFPQTTPPKNLHPTRSLSKQTTAASICIPWPKSKTAGYLVAGASIIWCIYDIDRLTARLSLNVFFYFKELWRCIQAWMRAVIQIFYP